jgi:hypothetical protein
LIAVDLIPSLFLLAFIVGVNKKRNKHPHVYVLQVLLVSGDQVPLDKNKALPGEWRLEINVILVAYIVGYILQQH